MQISRSLDTKIVVVMLLMHVKRIQALKAKPSNADFSNLLLFLFLSLRTHYIIDEFIPSTTP